MSADADRRATQRRHVLRVAERAPATTSVVALRRGPAPEGAATLASLCEQAGPLLRIAAAPHGLDVAVADVRVLDAGEESVPQAGEVVLVAGLATPGAALAAVEAAARARASAIVVKAAAAVSDAVLDLAHRHGIAVLATPPAVDWGDLHALIRAACGCGGAPGGAFAAGRDLYSLADAAAAAAGAPVTIEDARLEVIAYSRTLATDEERARTILARRESPETERALSDAGVLARLHAEEEVVRVRTPGCVPRRGIAIRAGQLVLGFAWIAGEDDAFAADPDDVLRELARAAAPRLVRDRLADDLERRVEGRWLSDLLAGEGPPALLAAQLGLAPDASFAVAAYVCEVPDDGHAALLARRLVNLVTMRAPSLGRPVLAVSLGRTVYALLADVEGMACGSGARLVRESAGAARRVLGVEVRAGLGVPAHGVERVPRSRRSADAAVRVAAVRGVAVVDAEEEGGAVLLTELDDRLPRLLESRSLALQRLRDHDARNGTAYVATLRAYLDAFGGVALAAERLYVHANTLRYRIRRICAIAGVELADPAQRLALELELRLPER